MGANTFFHEASGKNAKDAFRNAVEEAQYDHGHSGYTGTIAEKESFVMISLPEGTDPYTRAEELIDNGDGRVDDKWGPAGCIEFPPKDNDTQRHFLFFGWASS